MRQREEDREARMRMEILADAADEDERAMSWFNYLSDILAFPFIAHCRTRRAISPLQVGDEVDVIGMAPEDECHHEIFVLMRWERDGLAVPLAQLTIAYADDETRQAAGDWLYWVDRGYRF